MEGLGGGNGQVGTAVFFQIRKKRGAYSFFFAWEKSMLRSGAAVMP